MDFTLTETQSLLKIRPSGWCARNIRSMIAKRSSLPTPAIRRRCGTSLLRSACSVLKSKRNAAAIGGSFADLAIVLEAFGRGLVVEPYLSTVVVGLASSMQLQRATQRKDLLTQVAAAR